MAKFRSPLGDQPRWLQEMAIEAVVAESYWTPRKEVILDSQIRAGVKTKTLKALALEWGVSSHRIGDVRDQLIQRIRREMNEILDHRCPDSDLSCNNKLQNAYLGSLCDRLVNASSKQEPAADEIKRLRASLLEANKWILETREYANRKRKWPPHAYSWPDNPVPELLDELDRAKADLVEAKKPSWFTLSNSQWVLCHGDKTLAELQHVRASTLEDRTIVGDRYFRWRLIYNATQQWQTDGHTDVILASNACRKAAQQQYGV